MNSNKILKKVNYNTGKDDNSFASGLNFYKLFWVFFIGCFMGVILETLWCLATGFHFESRTGLIYGPFNVVYGVGILFMTICLYKLQDKRDLWIIIGGFIIGSIFEYLCSFVQEQLFGTISWDYSNYKFNLHGRVTMLYSFFWGILALIWVKHLYPLMSRLIEKIPNKIGKILTWVLVAFMIVNILMSSFVVARMAERHKDQAPSNKFEEYLDKHYPDERIKRIYPHMKYVD